MTERFQVQRRAEEDGLVFRAGDHIAVAFDTGSDNEVHVMANGRLVAMWPTHPPSLQCLKEMLDNWYCREVSDRIKADALEARAPKRTMGLGKMLAQTFLRWVNL